VDADRARQLVAEERRQVEAAIAALGGKDVSAHERPEPGDESSEDSYQDEFDADRAAEFGERLAAVERAEARIEAGTYGLSVVSGERIPDERLEALPTAERTILEERSPFGGGARGA
jgi:DnaK suppressor protein